MRRWTAWVCAGVALLASGCTGVGSAQSMKSPKPGQSARLLAYRSCSQFLSQVKKEALSEVGSSGLPTPGATFVSSAVGTAVPRTSSAPTMGAPMAIGGASGAANADSTAGTDQAASADAPAYSTTNDQEQGVDEPDLVKTNGQLLVALRENPVGLQVASLGASPRLRGFLPLGDGAGSPTGMFLMGNDAVVFSPGTGTPPPQPGAPSPTTPQGGHNNAGQSGPDLATPSPPTTEVTVVDLNDPDHPSIAHSFVVQGTEVDARLIAGYVELVVDSAPNLPFVVPTDGSTAASHQAVETNRALIRNSTSSDWLPSVTSEPSGRTTSPSCRSTLHTVAASGLDTVSVVPIVPDSSQSLPAVTVMGDATTVYASTSSLYVATSPWSELQTMPSAVGVAGGVASTGAGGTSTTDTTEVHGFDLSDPAAPRYLGSGEVPGSLIGQYALSEYQGYLRVATTVGTPSPAPEDGTAPTTLSDNRVTVLQPQGGALVTVGSVNGLGSGEKIYAVRFIGSLGFVVTFRQTDPLYVVDLSDPTDPRTAGQLALSGYSSFLQPVGNGLLLGIGQAVDQNLRTTGLQVSLFDVTNPSNPVLVSKLVYPGATSAAEDDPHALLYWAPSDLAVMPFSGSPYPDPTVDPSSDSSFNGAMAFRIGASGVTAVAQLSHPMPSTAPFPGCLACASSAGGPSAAGIGGVAESEPAIAPTFPNSSIERAVVVGNALYTVSESGIMANDLTSFAQVGWLPYS